MHSGHGDETPDGRYRQLPELPELPEPYSGVVPPPEQDGPLHHGEHVQPTGGVPWGSPSGAAQPLPPENTPVADATQLLPPYPRSGLPQGMALPPAFPPPASPPPPLPGGALRPEADATQYLPPYPGSFPPPAQPEAADATQYLGRPFQDAVPPDAPFGARQGGPQDPQIGPPAQVEPADATQHLPRFDEQDFAGQGFQGQGFADQGFRQQGYDGHGFPQQGPEQGAGAPYQAPYEAAQQPEPPQDDYDHLYRREAPGEQPAQRPYQPPQRPRARQAHPQAPHEQPHEQPYEPSGGGSGSRLSPAALIGIVVGGCALAGLAAGALMSGGGDGDARDARTVGASSPTASADPSATSGDGVADQQAKALDALLADSGGSRSSVISAVGSVKECQNLGKAAADLRAAAGQRNGLVTRLAALKIDRLPQHTDLSDALTRAWQASAAADSHYANWADQVAHDKKLCKGGRAHSTGEAQSGNRESGTASAQKKRAVRLWNTIAKQHGLSTRQIEQL